LAKYAPTAMKFAIGNNKNKKAARKKI